METTWRSRPSVKQPRQIHASEAVGGRPALDPGFEHPKFVVEMYEARQMPRRDAAKIHVAPEKRCRNARRHRERIAEIDARDVDDITHRFVHGQNRARDRSVVEPQAAVCAPHAAALQTELIGSAGCWWHCIGNSMKRSRRLAAKATRKFASCT